MRSDRVAIFYLVLEQPAALVQQIAQRVVDRAHGHGHVLCRGAVFFGKPVEDVADVGLGCKSLSSATNRSTGSI